MSTYLSHDTGPVNDAILNEEPTSFAGRMAHYRTQTAFEFPPGVSKWLRMFTGVAAKRVSDDRWELTDSGIRRARVHPSKREGRDMFSVNHAPVDDGLFGLSRCLYQAGKDVVFVTVTQRAPVDERRTPQPRRLNGEAAEPLPQTIDPKVVRLRDELRALLHRIRAVEASTPCRLIKEDGGDWVFTLPGIIR